MVDQRGFTLLETVLALSITAVLLLMALSAMRLGISSWERGGDLLDRSALKRNIIHRLEREMTSVYPFVLNEKEKRTAFLGKSGAVGFVTAASTPSEIPGARWVYYSYGEKGLEVREKHLTAEDLPSFEDGELVEAEPEVKGISFEYLGRDGWSSEWEPRKDEIPRALKAEFLLKDEGRLRVTFLPGAWPSGRAQ